MTITLKNLLFGAEFAINPFNQELLIITAIIWVLSFVYSAVYIPPKKRGSFFFFMGLMCLGNIGMILAQDIPTTYLFFGMMSFSALGLILYEVNPFSKYAAKQYLIYTMAGEMLIFAGFAFLHVMGSNTLLSLTPIMIVITTLILLGFGIKLGIMPFHGWLPLAHPAAPAPASAVLSALVIKTGLMGWVKFLPIGLIEFPELGMILMMLGLLTSLIAALRGLLESNPKAMLAYSSVSQMGFISLLIGIALMVPESWPKTWGVVMIFVAHHAFAKASLFFSTGIKDKTLFGKKWLFSLLIALPGLSLAGLPLSSGFFAKLLIKKQASLPFLGLGGNLNILLTLTGVTTALLIIKFISVSQNISKKEASKNKESLIKCIWGVSALISLLIPLVWITQDASLIKLISPSTIYKQLWPIMVAGFIFWANQEALTNLSKSNRSTPPKTTKSLKAFQEKFPKLKVSLSFPSKGNSYAQSAQKNPEMASGFCIGLFIIVIFMVLNI